MTTMTFGPTATMSSEGFAAVLASLGSTVSGRMGMPLLIPRDQLYYYSAAWQLHEKRAAAQIAAGQVHAFDDVEDAIAWLIEAE